MNVRPVPCGPATDCPAGLGQDAALPPLVDRDAGNAKPLGYLGQAHRLAVIHENDCTESLDRRLACTDNQYMTRAPEVGTVVRALTDTLTDCHVTIEVTSIESETARGWFVWGYNQRSRNAGRRRTLYPRRYFVERDQ